MSAGVHPSKVVALVVAVSDYEHQECLPSVANDAAAVLDQLYGVGVAKDDIIFCQNSGDPRRCNHHILVDALDRFEVGIHTFKGWGLVGGPAPCRAVGGRSYVLRWGRGCNGGLCRAVLRWGAARTAMRWGAPRCTKVLGHSTGEGGKRWE